MTDSLYVIQPEQERHQGGVRALLARAFGPLRMMRAIYRLREGVPPDPSLCFVIENSHGQVLATLRNYRVRVGQHPKPAILLGPLAVAHSHEKLALAAQLIRRSVDECQRAGYEMIYVVGNPDYYAEFGFSLLPAAHIQIANLEAGKVILGRELSPGASAAYSGLLQKDESVLLNQLGR